MLCDSKYCTGCTACASICPKGAITMVLDTDGFSYPAVNEVTCVNCGRCEQACPVLAGHGQGQPPKAYAARSLDTAMRLESSSGGVFTELAQQILSRGGAVCGAVYDENFQVIHVFAENEESLARMRGAKYAQSDLSGIFLQVRERLNHGQQVLFSGTPCQVAGLLGFLGKPYENLVTVDFVCHSIPSPMAWKAYIQYRSQQDNGGELPQSINLRSKETGWSHYQYSAQFQYANGISHTVKSSDNLFMKLFLEGYITRKSCSICQFKGYNRVSDLTIGDFWGVWDIIPEMDDNKGTSIILVQSPKGSKMLEEIIDKLVLKEVTLEEAGRQNPAIFKSSISNKRRKEALIFIRTGRIEKCAKWFKAPNLLITHKLLHQVKRLICNRIL